MGHPVYISYIAAIISLLFFPLFFSLRGARRHAVDIIVNDPFSDLPFFGSDRRNHMIRDHKSAFGFSQKYATSENVFILLFLSISKALLFLNRSKLDRLRFVIVDFDPFGLFLCFKVCCLCPSRFGLYNLLLNFEDFI